MPAITVVNTTLIRPRDSYILTSRSDHDVQPVGTLRAAAIHRVFRPMISRHPGTGVNPTVCRNQTRRPTCWDPPRQRTDNCYPPPYRDPDMVLDSYVEPQNSYARHLPWQPQYHPCPATKEEDPINAKLDLLLEAFDRMETWVDATNLRFSKFRSSPQPEPDLDQPTLGKRAYPPLGNNEVSFWPSRLVPNDSAAPPRHRTKSNQTLARLPSCWEPLLMATPAVDQIHQPYQPPQSLPRSNRQPQQPSPAPPLELLPYSAPGPS